MVEINDLKKHDSIYRPRIHGQILKELRELNEKTGVSLPVLIDRALMNYLEDENNFSGLKEIITGVLTLNDGLCMDDQGEREILADTLTQTILKGKKHGEEAAQ